jgi:hypothetical protein
MGIHGFRQLYNLWKQYIPELLEVDLAAMMTSTADKRAVVIDVLAAGIRSLRCDSGTRLVSMPQLCQSWSDKFISGNVKKGYRCMALLVDIPSLVTKEKREEQYRRKYQQLRTLELAEEKGEGEKKDVAIPYEDGTCFTDIGELLIGGVGTPVPFIDLDRLDVSPKSLRMQIWRFIVAWLGTSEASADWTPDTIVLLDCKEGGPFLFRKEYSTKVLPSLSHCFGEADVMVPFYLRLLRNRYHCVVSSVDSDVVIIVLNHIRMDSVREPDTKKLPIYMDRAGLLSSGPGHMDMRAIEKWHGDRLFAVTAVALMTGTDFVDKSTLVDRIGDDFLFTWALGGHCVYKSPRGWDMREVLRIRDTQWGKGIASPYYFPSDASITSGDGDIFDHWESAVDPVEIKLAAMIQEIRTAYKAHMAQRSIDRRVAQGLSPTAKSSKKKKKATAPVMTTVHIDGLLKWFFNMQYWDPDMSVVGVDIATLSG